MRKAVTKRIGILIVLLNEFVRQFLLSLIQYAGPILVFPFHPLHQFPLGDDEILFDLNFGDDIKDEENAPIDLQDVPGS